MDRTKIELKAIIVDDEKRGISALRQLIEKYIDGVKVVGECLKPDQGLRLIEELKPEIVFLDINMPGMNGFEMLDRLSWKGFNLVFTTAHQEFGLKALKNNAIDYLLKPVNHIELNNTINRIREKMGQNQVTVSFQYAELYKTLHQHGKTRLVVHSTMGVEHIDPDDVICLESLSNYTKIVLLTSHVITRKTLKEFEVQLCRSEYDFMRVHNSFIINLTKVSRYLKANDEIILAGEVSVPLSKSRRSAFFSWMKI